MATGSVRPPGWHSAVEQSQRIASLDGQKSIAGQTEFGQALHGQAREHGLAERVREVLFSPVFPDPAGKWTGLEARELAEWILADGLPVRLGLQLHKFIWDPAMKGV